MSQSRVGEVMIGQCYSLYSLADRWILHIQSLKKSIYVLILTHYIYPDSGVYILSKCGDFLMQGIT